jgi:hypothetical protein
MYWIRWFFKELWWYLTYEHYGRRRLRPATWGLLFTLPLLAAFYLLALWLGQRSALPGERPAPTLPPLTKTAIFAAVTATAQTPTRTPAPRCPEDPRLWRLVEVRPFLDPKTGQPLPLPKPVMRIEPTCVYEGFLRDLTEVLIAATRNLSPTAAPRIAVPWFELPGDQIVERIFQPVDDGGVKLAFYDSQGKRIDEAWHVYNARPTGNPDFPVVLYVDLDVPQPAWAVNYRVHPETGLRVTTIGRVRLEGASGFRHVYVWFYDARQRRWFLGGFVEKTERRRYAVDVNDRTWAQTAQAFGLPYQRRSELLARFSLPDAAPPTLPPRGEDTRTGTLHASPDGAWWTGDQ